MSRAEPEVPIDSIGDSVYNTNLKVVALERTVQALGASFLITLQADTKFIEVYAIAQDVLLRWADNDTDFVKIENFHEIIRAGSKEVYAVPNQIDGAPYTRIMLVGRVAGSTAIVLEK